MRTVPVRPGVLGPLVAMMVAAASCTIERPSTAPRIDGNQPTSGETSDADEPRGAAIAPASPVVDRSAGTRYGAVHRMSPVLGDGPASVPARYRAPAWATTGPPVTPATCQVPASVPSLRHRPPEPGNAAATASEPQPSDSQERARELYLEGSALYSASDYVGAIEVFTEALKVVTRTGGLEPEVRGALIHNLAQSHVKAHGIDRDDAHLRAARDLFARYLDEADSAGFEVDDEGEIREQIAGIDERLASTDTDRDREQAQGESEAPAAKEDRPASAHRGPGIGLVSAGAVLLAGGIGMIVWGTRFEPMAEDEIGNPSDPTDAQQSFLDDEIGKGRIWMGVGGGVMALGLAGVIVGAVLLARSKRTPNVAVLPRTDGITASWRF